MRGRGWGGWCRWWGGLGERSGWGQSPGAHIWFALGRRDLGKIPLWRTFHPFLLRQQIKGMTCAHAHQTNRKRSHPEEIDGLYLKSWVLLLYIQSCPDLWLPVYLSLYYWFTGQYMLLLCNQTCLSWRVHPKHEDYIQGAFNLETHKILLKYPRAAALPFVGQDCIFRPLCPLKECTQCEQNKEDYQNNWSHDISLHILVLLSGLSK